MKNTGTNFENKVLNTIIEAINDGKLGLIPDSCKVYTQKGYYSKDREGDIKTDISIEVYVANATEPSIIWVWECKDYKKSIPVDDIEEFHAKLQQIGSDKTKGTLITSLGAFQRSSINFAKSKGIGLARLMPDEQVKWHINMMLPEMLPGNLYINRSSNAQKALSQINFTTENHDFYVTTSDSKLTNEQSLRSYITSELTQMLKLIKYTP